ncbi:MAG: LPS assembly lipoprotein LptE [Lentimicrobiaceae bacterium]|nr:LPS assembly lipoprotein LptE [Lentimicrobiaceae bacterium]
MEYKELGLIGAEGRRQKGERRRGGVLFAFVLLCVFVFGSCRVHFSLTGGSVNPNAKTVYVATFPNNASLINPNLSQEFTTALKDKIQSQTPLTIIDLKYADYVFEGAITNYTITPIALQGDDKAAMNRLTISVRVTFKNKFEETLNFDQTFQRYSDYSSALNFTNVESGLMQEIVSALTEDIFNKAFVNW